METGFGSKKDFTVYLKDYMKKVVKYLEENDRAGEVDDFKKNISGVMKKLLGEIFDEKEIAVLEGGVSTSTELLKLPFNHIFFTLKLTCSQVCE